MLKYNSNKIIFCSQVIFKYFIIRQIILSSFLYLIKYSYSIIDISVLLLLILNMHDLKLLARSRYTLRIVIEQNHNFGFTS